MSKQKFDVIVVGGGHAGVEAALAASRVGGKTLLLTHNIDTIGQMSCNPAVGGIGKGHLVKEIDALGGVMGRAADIAGIHYRTLNSRKGPAVRATRAQADRSLYKQAIISAVWRAKGLEVLQQAVDDLLIEKDRVAGVVTATGIVIHAKTVVLTAGTFLNGKIYVGKQGYAAGRAGEGAAVTLAERIKDLSFAVARLKTGTPPRIDGRSIDFSQLEKQPGETPIPYFSDWDKSPGNRQINCFLARTNAATHQIIADSLQESAMYSGEIEGLGPRYCPSIEDKIVKFKERDSHQVFLEPEGLATQEIYPNGISTSLPFEVQLQMIRSIKGMGQAKITRVGYAVEYDFFDPRGLTGSLETKAIAGLFFAGQINGTTGYEEAAAQGLVAGLNAARAANELESWVPKRAESYIGVLIDDLVTNGTNEPYRMFTSRAEHRLLLREDNADIRLSNQASKLGLITEARAKKVGEKQHQVAQEVARLGKITVHHSKEDGLLFQRLTGEALEREYKAIELLKRPAVTYTQLSELAGVGKKITDAKAVKLIEATVKYDGYIAKQQKQLSKLNQEQKIPDSFKFDKISGLSNEVVEKLQIVRPRTLSQASRISGITPAAIAILQVQLKKHKAYDNSTA